MVKRIKKLILRIIREFYIRNLCNKSGYKITSNKEKIAGCRFLEVMRVIIHQRFIIEGNLYG